MACCSLRLVRKPAVSDLFGKQGRRWLESLELPGEEQDEKRIASEALRSPEIRRLMTVPGVNVICGGDLHGGGRRHPPLRRSPQAGRLPGIGPEGAQVGSFRDGARANLKKQGSSSARHALVEASWSVVKAPGPMHSYYQRIRARRGGQVAIVATSRKLACLFWCLLTREEDYAYAQPSLTAKKLRRLELAAGAPKGAEGWIEPLWWRGSPPLTLRCTPKSLR